MEKANSCFRRLVENLVRMVLMVPWSKVSVGAAILIPYIFIYLYKNNKTNSTNT